MTRRPSHPALRTLLASLVLLLVLGSVGSARADIPLANQTNVSYTDPNGQGTTTYTLFYNLPQSVQVGTNLVVPFKLYVDNLTRLEGYVNSYNVTLTLSLGNGRQVTDVVGVSGSSAAENLGALQLHAGQGWGPVNFTLALTTSNTGLAQGQQVLGNATFNVYSQVYFNQPINDFRFQSSTAKAAYMAVQDGVPAGPETNYLGIGILVVGVLMLVASVAMRRRGPKAEAQTKKSAGAV